MKDYRAGIDVGSTTVKFVMIDDDDAIIFSDYRRHCSKIQETLADLLSEAVRQVGNCGLRMMITGSGSINLGKALGIGYANAGGFLTKLRGFGIRKEELDEVILTIRNK